MQRTNEAGAEQLTDVLRNHDYTTTLVDIRGSADLLHLKSGLSFVGNRLLVLNATLAARTMFQEFETIVVDPAEGYAANCVLVNGYVLMAEGYPRLADDLAAHGQEVIPLQMSEFRKMDGGLSCLSLRF
jgi:dimethylargininase